MRDLNAMSYIARKPCGCICAVIADEPQWKRETAKEVAAWIRHGLSVERVTHQYVRENFNGDDCQHEVNVPKQSSLFETEVNQE